MIAKRPLITVIMPCYNAEKYVAEAIESVLRQTYSEIELIIVDDGSTDNSLTICRQFESRVDTNICIEMQKNKGPYPARNLGLSKAHGSYIAFLDADDYWSDDCLQALYDGMDRHKVDVAYCGWQNVGEGGPGSIEPYLPPEYEKFDIVKAFLRSCPWPIHAALIKRDIIDRLNGFSERYFTSLDFDLWLRMTAVTQKIIQVPKVMAYYRWHDSGQISSVKSRQVIDAWNVKQDFVKNNPQIVSHFAKDELNQLICAGLLSNAYTAYWRRNIDSASILFRKAFSAGYWKFKDLKFILIAFLPPQLVKKMLCFFSKT